MGKKIILEEVLEEVNRVVKEVWIKQELDGNKVIKIYQPELDNGTKAVITLLKRGEKLWLEKKDQQIVC